MSYLRLIQDKIQDLAEAVSSSLSIDVTVVDENLVRIVGTGDFYQIIDQNSPENSLFAKIIQTGKPEINVIKKDSSVCKSCKNFDQCKEMRSMAYPIQVDGENIGVVSFASFNPEQEKIMCEKNQQYYMMLKHIAEAIEKEVLSIKMVNKLKIGKAEINEIINCINNGIIIINSENKIIHINVKALKILDINFSHKRIIDKRIDKVIKGFKEVEDTHKKEMIGNWNVGEKNIKVVYKVNDIVLDKQNISKLISFDGLEEIINIAMTYNKEEKVTFSQIVGRSPKLMEAINKAKIAAQSDSTILLRGESGTGKELFARSIHNESARKKGPFVALNCANMPESLIESELFGYEKGAFTGANIKGKMGKFELAHNGTLFLDEIGDLSLNLQAKLLRVLQEKKVDRIGGSSPIKVNVRIISATHKNLEGLMKENKFRLDLFYRLNVIPIHLPALRERDTDVLFCSEYILKKLCQRLHKKNKVLSKEVEEKFLQYDWPGNVRELENVLEYAVNFSTGEEILLKDLPEYFLNHKIEDLFDLDPSGKKGLDERVKEYEKRILKRYIKKYGDTTEGKRKIAKELKISLTTLYRKLNDYH